MRKRVSVIALLMFGVFLFGASGAAIAGEQDPKEGPFLSGAGSLMSPNRPFIEPLDAYCESDCCWAWCSGYGCSVECSSASCSAQSGGESAKYTCNAT